MEEFSGKRTVKSHTMRLAGRPEKVFPLLCPTREYDWIEPWDCELIRSDSGVAELDCIFRTHFPADGPEDVWVVSRYEPPKEIQFVRINGLRAIRYAIDLGDNGNGTTTAVWRQVVTGLSPEGNAFVRDFSDDRYASAMSTLERMLNHYLTTGTMLRAR